MQDEKKNPRRPLFRLLYALLLIVVPVLCLNFAAGLIVARKASERQYMMKIEKKNGDRRFLICHENPTNDHYDLTLNYELSYIKGIEIIGDPVDTNNPVSCVSYPLDYLEPESRYAALEAKKPGEKRIAFVGDSFTFGEGVRIGDAFPEQINKYLGFYGNPENWTCLNFGRMGDDFPDIHTKDFKAALRSRPDRIVYVWFANDMPRGKWGFPEIMDMNDLINKKNFFAMNRGALPLQLLIRNAIIQRRTAGETIKWTRRINGPDNPEGVGEFRNYLGKMKGESRSAGADFSVALFPMIVGSAGDYPFRRENEFIKKILKEEGIPAYDLTDSVLSLPADRLWIHPVNHHPNFIAHRLAAKALIGFLRLPTAEPVKGGAGDGTHETVRAIPPRIYEGYKGNETAALLFYLIFALFAFFIAALAMNVRPILGALWSGDRRANVAFLLTCVLALALRVWLAPRWHLIFNDEFCRLKVIEMWMAGRYDAETLNNLPGTTMYYFMFMKVFGASPVVGSAAALAACMLSLVLLYAFTRFIWEKDEPALIAALVFATFPIAIRFSLAQAAENPNVFVQLAAAFAAALHIRKRDVASLLLLAASCAVLLYIRMYNIVFVCLLPMFIAAARMMEDAGRRTAGEFVSAVPGYVLGWLRKPRYMLTAVFILLNVAAFAYWFYLSVTMSVYSEHIKRLSESVPANLIGNAGFFVKNRSMPMVYTALFIAGTGMVFVRSFRLPHKRKWIAFFFLWTAVYFLCHLTSEGGDYNIDVFFDTVRYTLDFGAPLFLLISMGMYGIYSILPRPKGKLFIFPACLFVLLVPVHFLYAVNFRTEETTMIKGVEEEIGNYPPDTIFYTNIFEIHYKLSLEYMLDSRVVKTPVEIPKSCEPGRKCVFVLYNNPWPEFRESHAEFFENCFSKNQYINSYMVFCPIEAATKLPESAFSAHIHSSLVTDTFFAPARADFTFLFFRQLFLTMRFYLRTSCQRTLMFRRRR